MEGLHVNPNVNPNTADSLPPAWLAVFHLLVWAGFGPYLVIAFEKKGPAWHKVCAGAFTLGVGFVLLRWGLRRRVSVDRRVRPKARDHLDCLVGALVMLMAWFLDEDSFPRWIGLFSSTVYGGYTTLYIASPEVGLGFMELFMGVQHSYKHYKRVWVILLILAVMCVTTWIRNHLRDRIEGSHGVGVYHCLTNKLRDLMGVERYTAMAGFFQGRQVVLWCRGDVSTLPVVVRRMTPEERRVAIERQNRQLSALLEDEQKVNQELKGQIENLHSEISQKNAALEAQRAATRERDARIGYLEKETELLNVQLNTAQRACQEEHSHLMNVAILAMETNEEQKLWVQLDKLEARNNEHILAIQELQGQLVLLREKSVMLEYDLELQLLFNTEQH